MLSMMQPTDSGRYSIIKYISRDGIHYDTWEELKEADRKADERLEEKMKEGLPMKHNELKELPHESNIRHSNYSEFFEGILKYLHIK